MTQINCLGIPYDLNGSFLRGPALAPDLIWQAYNSPSANTFNEAYKDMKTNLNYDGSIYIDNFEEDIRGAVAKALQRGALITLGGDHSVTYPTIQAYAAQYSKLSILHIDAHPDVYADFDGNRFSHASPFARIMEDGLVNRIVQVGIRTATQHQHEQIDKYGITSYSMNQFDESQHMDLEGPVFISLDIDALDPAFAPGVSHYEPGGLSTRQLINFIQNQKHLKVIGADLVEYNPARDINGMTAMVAAKLLKELATLMVEG